MRFLHTLSIFALAALLAWGAQSALAARVEEGASHASDDQLAREEQPTSEDRLARAALEEISRTYRYLEGVTVEFGSTPNGEEAVSYYERGRIVIDPAHEAGVNPILEHEVWHIIDWRDNGRLDWGEQVPPPDAERFLR